MQDPKILGKAIRELREEKNLTQAELGRLVGYQNGSRISKLECGHGPTTVSLLCAVLNALGSDMGMASDLYNRIEAQQLEIGSLIAKNKLDRGAAGEKLAEEMRLALANFEAKASQ